MAMFLSHPKFQAFDNNGDPLNGGKLHIYEPGTTTNKNSYPTIADAVAGTNANANPVILDSRGEADIVLRGNCDLKLVDSSDVTIWTLDNVNLDFNDILDNNGNELLTYTSNASAVNQVDIANSSSGNPVEISAAGDDTNIDINLVPKGTGVIRVKGTSSNSGTIVLMEDTDNGSHGLTLSAPSALAADVNFVLPNADGSANTAIITDAAGNLSFSTLTAVAASQAEMEAASSTTVPVTPGRTKYHPGVAKAWALYDHTANSLNASYNVSSVTDSGTGVYVVNLATSFSSATYAVVATNNLSTAGSNAVGATSLTTGSYTVSNYTESPADTAALTDASICCSVAFGDQ